MLDTCTNISYVYDVTSVQVKSGRSTTGRIYEKRNLPHKMAQKYANHIRFR